MDPECLGHHNPSPMEKQKWWVKTAAWWTFRRRSTLHHAVKRVTVQGPVTKPKMDYMSHRGFGLWAYLPESEEGLRGPRSAALGKLGSGAPHSPFGHAASGRGTRLLL